MKRRLLVLLGICAFLDWLVVKADHYTRDYRNARTQLHTIKKLQRSL